MIHLALVAGYVSYCQIIASLHVSLVKNVWGHQYFIYYIYILHRLK